MDFGETLTEANKGRPAIRGQTSAKLLYQQGIATNGVNNGEAGAAIAGCAPVLVQLVLDQAHAAGSGDKAQFIPAPRDHRRIDAAFLAAHA